MELITICSIIVSVLLLFVCLHKRLNIDCEIQIEELKQQAREAEEHYRELKQKFDLVMDSYIEAEKRIRGLEREKVQNV